MTETLRTLLLAALSTLGMIGWMSFRTLRLAAGTPDRLVAELRLAQVSAVVLALTAGAYIGLAAARDSVPGAGLDVAFALGFLIVAVFAPLRDPHEALLALALAFTAHAALDVLHRPNWLAEAVVPSWFAIGCAIHNALAGIGCYAPVLRR
ncbi:MAG: hypothetical protein AB7I50_06370 [Vicinamibacterales bacterium]